MIRQSGQPLFSQASESPKYTEDLSMGEWRGVIGHRLRE
jgi:hypothetical protein